MSTITVETDRFLALKMMAALVFIALFLCGAVWTMVSWADEGPDVHYTPPAYNRTLK